MQAVKRSLISTANPKPIIRPHDGVTVVREDLYPGGTKARVFVQLFARHKTIVYASPAEGGAQTALAYAAQATGNTAVIFTAARATPHPRTLLAKRLGADIHLIRPGYLSVVQARARQYAEALGAFLLPFGADTADTQTIIATAAQSLELHPKEVWCAAGSGTLTRALQHAWPDAIHHAVQVGRDCDTGAAVHRGTPPLPAGIRPTIPNGRPLPIRPQLRRQSLAHANSDAIR